MRTLSLTLLAALSLAAGGCEKTIHEASRPALPPAPVAEQHEPRVVPAVDGVPIA